MIEFHGLRLGHDVIKHTMTVDSDDVEHEISIGKPIARFPNWFGLVSVLVVLALPSRHIHLLICRSR